MSESSFRDTIDVFIRCDFCRILVAQEIIKAKAVNDSLATSKFGEAHQLLQIGYSDEYIKVDLAQFGRV